MSFNSFASVSDYLHSVLEPKGVIGIDGWMGAGKTQLARELASKFGACWALDLDAFIMRGQDQFVAALQLPSLAAAIAHSNVPVALSGVCLLDVAQRIDLKIRAHVYLKRMSSGVWADEDDAIGNDLVRLAAAGFEAGALEHKVHNCHSQFQPHENADVVIEIELREPLIG